MASLDVPVRAVAEKVIRNFGASAEVVRREAGNYNSTTGKRAKAEYVSAVRGIWSTFRVSERDDQYREGDRKFIVPAKMMDFDPHPGDHLKIANRELRIVGADPTMSGDEAAIWTLHIRGTDA